MMRNLTRGSKIKLGCLSAVLIVVVTTVVITMTYTSKLEADISHSKQILSEEGVDLTLKNLYVHDSKLEPLNIESDFEKLGQKFKIENCPTYKGIDDIAVPVRLESVPSKQYDVWYQKHLDLIKNIWQLVDLVSVKPDFIAKMNTISFGSFEPPPDWQNNADSTERMVFKFAIGEAERARYTGRLEDSIMIVKKLVPFTKIKYSPMTVSSEMKRLGFTTRVYREMWLLATMPNVDFSQLDQICNDLYQPIDFKEIKKVEITSFESTWSDLQLLFAQYSNVFKISFVRLNLESAFLKKMQERYLLMKPYENGISAYRALDTYRDNENRPFTSNLRDMVDSSFTLEPDLYIAFYSPDNLYRFTKQILQAFKQFSQLKTFPDKLPIRGNIIEICTIDNKPFSYLRTKTGFKLWTAQFNGVKPTENLDLSTRNLKEGLKFEYRQ